MCKPVPSDVPRAGGALVKVVLAVVVAAAMIVSGQYIIQSVDQHSISLASLPSWTLSSGKGTDSSSSHELSSTVEVNQVNATLCLAYYELWPGNDVGACGTGNVIPEYALFDPMNGDVYVTEAIGGGLSVVSGSSYNQVANVAVGAGKGMAYDGANGDIYVTIPISNDVTVVSGADNAVVATIPVGGEPSGATYDSANGDVYITNSYPYSDNVSVVSGATNKVVASIPVGSDPSGAAYDTENGDIYVTNYGSSNVSVVSGARNAVVANITVGYSPLGIVYDSANGDIYVTNYGSNNVSVVSGVSNKVVANIPVGSEPVGAAFDSGNGDIYIINLWSGNVSVVSGASNTVMATIPTANGCGLGAAYDNANGDIYVVENGFDSLSIIGPVTSPPRINSFYAAPISVIVNQTTAINVTAAWGTGGLSYSYTGLPSGCTSVNTAKLICTPDASGSYTVQVYVNDTVGETARSNLTLPVIPILTSRAWDLPAAGTAPLNVTFTSDVTGGEPAGDGIGYTYLWNFGDQSSSSLPNPVHLYSLVGVYYVNLTVKDSSDSERDYAGQVSYDDLTVTVCAPGECGKLTADEVATPTTGLAPLSVEFTGSAYGGTPPWTFSWNFGDGGTSTQQSPTHTYTKDGTYQATVTVRDSSGATATNSTTITVGNGGSTPSNSGTGIQLFGLSTNGTYTMIGGVIVVVGVVAAIAVARGKRRAKTAPPNYRSSQSAGPAYSSGPEVPATGYVHAGPPTPPGVSQPSGSTYSPQPFESSQSYAGSLRQPALTPVPKRFCPECGTKNVPTAKFCEGCGKGMPPPS